MSRNREQLIPIILSFAFLLLSIVGFFSYRSSLSAQEAVESQKQSRETLLDLDETLTAAVDIETAVTAFVINDSESYLEPYDRAKPKLKEKLASLHTLMSDDPEEMNRLNDLEKILDERVSTAGQIIELRRREGHLPAVQRLASRDELDLMDRVRASIDTLKSRELNLLETHEQELDAARNRTIAILILGTVAGLISLVFANFVLMSETRKRKSAETALIDANRDLEKKVGVRTAELKAANETLTEINAEREKLLVDEQQARKEAEIANRLRDEFLATVSHELRTPLNSILGWARLLKSGSLSGDQSEKAVSTIVKNSETQNRLIEDLLDVARIISGKLDLEHDNIDVGSLISSAVETVEPAASSRNVRLVIDVEKTSAGSYVTGDRDRLRQVLWNLLTNAIKFSPEGAEVTIEGVESDGHVEIAVKDHGCGISPKFLPDVFERFRQDTSNRKRSGGLGLGLAVVRNLVEMHGGTVSAHSDGENKGAEFVVRLPVAHNGPAA